MEPYVGRWRGTEVELEITEGAQPYHARAFPLPKVHTETLKIEVERLCKLGVLKKVNRSQWAAPTFVIPKKDGTVRFIVRSGYGRALPLLRLGGNGDCVVRWT